MNQSTFFTLKYPERQKEDAVLLRHLINHEDDALSVFLDMYGPLLLGYSGAFIRPAEDREDVVHDMLMEVWNRPPVVQEEKESFYKWLIFAIRRRIIAKCREDISEGKNSPMSPEELISKIRTDDQSAWHDTLLRGARKTVIAAYIACTPEQQQILILAFFEGMNCQEIAAKLQCLPEAVPPCLSEAVHTFYRSLTKSGNEEIKTDNHFPVVSVLYVINTCDDPERKIFEAHLSSGCTQCQQIVSEYRDVLALMPLMLRPIVPAPEFKDRILFSAQLALVMKASTSPDDATQTQPPPVKDTVRIPDNSNGVREYKILIGGMLLIIILLAGYLFFLSDRVQRQNKEIADQQGLITTTSEHLEEVNDILGVLNAPDLQMITLRGTIIEKSAHGKIFCSKTMHAAVLQVANMPVQPNDKEYRLWMHAEKTMYLLHKFSIQKYLSTNYLTRFELPELLPKTEGSVFLVTLESLNEQAEPKGKQCLVGLLSEKSSR